MTFPVVPGAGNLPKVILVASDGARAEVYLHGAHVTSWSPALDGADRLFLSSRSGFGPGAAIRGGIPVCFPQFAAQGPLPNHGFARVSPWDLVSAEVAEDGAARAALRLVSSAGTQHLWPHAFALELGVRLSGESLAVTLAVTNTGSASFSFTAALHSYLGVADIAETTVHGLEGAPYYDKILDRRDCREATPCVRIDGAIDRVYHAPPNLMVRERNRSLSIRALGFPDTVVWNPGAGARSLADLEAGAERRMLCVEAAAAATPVVLPARAVWRGAQELTAC
jgi:glucose-6-phosphate 1-epimerase